jgi:uncharacterized RDD family membrane protein YckC
MVYCWKCGTESQDNAGFCHKCGAQLRPVAGIEGLTGFERLRDDKSVQDHWLRRVIAYIIDAFTVSILVLVIGVISSVPFLIGSVITAGPLPAFPSWWGLWFGIIPLLLFGYFVFADMLYGGTFGKHAMGLRVRRVDGRHVDFWSALVRNVSKIFFLLLILDLAVGLAERGEVSQKFSDRYAGTKVETVTQMNLIR